MHICRKGLHCTHLTGTTADGRCLACRRESHRRAQAAYDKTDKGQATTQRYAGTVKYMLRAARYDATQRGH